MFEVKKVVGVGSYSKVCLIKEKRNTSSPLYYAMKVIRKSTIKEKHQENNIMHEKEALVAL